MILAVGYFSGVIRANSVSAYTTFMFDLAVLGFYISLLIQPKQTTSTYSSIAITSWITALTLWPLFISAIPQNDPLVQFVAFRATAWFLPMIWIGSSLKAADLRLIATSLAGLNLIALVFGVYEYFAGVEAIYPANAVTQIIYKSNSTAGFLRIPSTFLNAHAYGGTMACSLPLMLGGLLDSKGKQGERAWLLAGLIAACGGILLCAARQPIVVAILIFFITWVLRGCSFGFGVGFASIIGIGAFLVSSNDRLQRILSLKDSDQVSARIYASVNENFLDIFVTYPFGAGMGSSAGTSVPYFLASRAPKRIGLENEYCRILVDQGWVGLLLWGMFLLWVHWPPPKRSRVGSNQTTIQVMYAMTLTTWATATIGSGLLAAVPGAVLLLIQMGYFVGQRDTDSRPSTAIKPPYKTKKSASPLNAR